MSESRVTAGEGGGGGGGGGEEEGGEGGGGWGENGVHVVHVVLSTHFQRR